MNGVLTSFILGLVMTGAAIFGSFYKVPSPTVLAPWYAVIWFVIGLVVMAGVLSVADLSTDTLGTILTFVTSLLLLLFALLLLLVQPGEQLGHLWRFQSFIVSAHQADSMLPARCFSMSPIECFVKSLLISATMHALTSEWNAFRSSASVPSAASRP